MHVPRSLSPGLGSLAVMVVTGTVAIPLGVATGIWLEECLAQALGHECDRNQHQQFGWRSSIIFRPAGAGDCSSASFNLRSEHPHSRPYSYATDPSGDELVPHRSHPFDPQSVRKNPISWIGGGPSTSICIFVGHPCRCRYRHGAGHRYWCSCHPARSPSFCLPPPPITSAPSSASGMAGLLPYDADRVFLLDFTVGRLAAIWCG